jgi:hypothetical protein
MYCRLNSFSKRILLRMVSRDGLRFTPGRLRSSFWRCFFSRVCLRVAARRAFLPGWFAPVLASYLLWHGQHKQRSSGLGFSGSWFTCAAPRCSVAPHSSQRHPARCLQAVARSFQLAGYVATPLIIPEIRIPMRFGLVNRYAPVYISAATHRIRV